MADLQSSSFTHSSYQAANEAARKSEGVTFTSDAGNGWTHLVHFNGQRLVHTSVSPEGITVF